MVRASFVLHTEESGCNGKKSKSYDEIASDIMFDIKVSELEKNVDVRCLSWVNFLYLEAINPHLLWSDTSQRPARLSPLLPAQYL